MFHTDDGGSHTVVALGVGCGVWHFMLDGERTQSVRLQTHHDDAVRHGGEGGTPVVVSVMVKGDVRQGGRQVQFTVVVRHLTLRYSLVRHLQTAEREVLHAVRPFDESLVDEVLRLFLLSVEDEVAHIGQIALRRGAVVVVRTSAPERVLVQLQLVGLCASVNHSAQPSVTDWQGFQPDGGRFVVPQTFGVVVLLRPGDTCASERGD